MSTPNAIKTLEQKRVVILAELLEIETMIRGSFGRVYRKCGSSKCWCATQEGGHPLDRINYSDDGRSRTKAISEHDVQWAKQMTDNYKRYRKNRQALRALNQKLNSALDTLEAKRVERTARKRNYVI
jgi:hypothetical protein